MKQGNNILMRRFGAFLIDSVILSIIGFILCNTLSNFLFKIASFAIWIGFLIFILYYGIQNSSICHGQTLGKRIFKIKVVDKNLDYISLNKSLLRALCLAPMFIFNNIGEINATQLVLSIIISVYSFLEFALVLFNTPTRQTLHDLIAKSYVLSMDSEECSDTSKNKVIIIISIVIALSLIGLTFIKNIQNKVGINMKEVLELSQKLDKNYKQKLVLYTVNVNYSTQMQNTAKVVSLGIDGNKINFENETECFYNTLRLANFLNKNNLSYDFLNISLIKRINLGISSFSKAYSKSATKAQWEEAIKTYGVK